MAIELVNTMEKQPGVCLACGQTGTVIHDNFGRPIPAIDLNVDVDWGNNAYLCGECGHLIATLLGRDAPEDTEKLREKLQDTQDRLIEAEEKLAEQEVDLSRIREGAKTIKKVRA